MYLILIKSELDKLCLSMTGTFIVIVKEVGQLILSSLTGIGGWDHGCSTKTLALVISRIQKGA